MKIKICDECNKTVFIKSNSFQPYLLKSRLGNIIEGTEILYYDDEKKKIKSIINYKNRKKHGEFKFYHENGSVALVTFLL